MKKTLFLATAVISVLMLSVWGGYAQPMGPGMMGPGYGYGSPPQQNWNYCPYCGSPTGPGYGMGPGMMGRGYGGYGMGPGMMGRGYGGYGMGPGMMGPGYGYGTGPGYRDQYGQQYQQPSKPLDKDEAKQKAEEYLKATRNPNLKLGRIEDKGDDYEVSIETKEGSLVDKILVDKDTGRMRSAY